MMERTLLRTETDSRRRAICVFRCSFPGCDREYRIRQKELSRNLTKCKCISHAQVKRPFESLYNGLKHDWRRTEVLLTYEEYLEFTQASGCHYCGDKINWVPYPTVNQKYISRAYYLDRKDLSGPYSKGNCVVCCTKCNMVRRDFFSYEEFMLLAPALRKIRETRGKL